MVEFKELKPVELPEWQIEMLVKSSEQSKIRNLDKIAEQPKYNSGKIIKVPEYMIVRYY